MGIKEDTFVDCIGTVAILTENNVVFQGQIVRDENERGHESFGKFPNINIRLDLDPEFVVLRLTCEPALLTDDANIEEINPDLYQEGDLVRISLNEIVAVGPSRGCLESVDPPGNFTVTTGK